MGKNGLQCRDINYAVSKTENYVIGDLERLSRRIAYVTKLRDSTVVEIDDIVGVLREFVPLHQPQQNFKKKLNLSWDDVGGLKNVKKILTEIFIWPSKYPKLFQNCPVKIGRGVLLYGPSGCGKTLVAKVVASQSSFNVIHVKGPELLSKYIGESEKNIRDLFERAKMSKPSLIFFDEFDSLAVKRGNDSTGVTDRVVNQLLTELDGLEDREGVYVIATTNRLDLVDCAVIRPGRFDFILECTLPNQDDRMAILKVLTRKLRVHSSVDFAWIVSQTDGWSGADLKGLVNSAQLFADAILSDELKDVNNRGVDDDDDDDVIVLWPEHFMRAFKEREDSRLQNKQLNISGRTMDSVAKLKVTMA